MAFGPFTRFVLAQAADDQDRRVLLEAAARRTSGVDYRTFNVYNVRLDFDRGEATVEDVLDASVVEVSPLGEFLAAVAAGGASDDG